MSLTRTLVMILAGVAAALPAAGQEASISDDAPEKAPAAALDSITIVGSTEAARDTAGSAQYIGPEELDRFEYGDIQRVLRSVPGVYIQDEEGYGLRPNIGIRGSGLDRSSRIALLEDGVLIAPAPYAAPSAYYFPTQRRMSAVEVLKGPSSIPVGLRTTGGAVNMLSTPIPSGSTGRLDVAGGPDSSRDVYGHYGWSGDRVGFMAEFVDQDTEGFKDLDRNDNQNDTGYDLNDYFGKFRVNNDPSSRWFTGVEAKFGYTRQKSNASYLGLTDDDFDKDAFRRYAGSQFDQLTARHWHRQATWFLEPNDAAWGLSVTAYDMDFSRNWYKLQSVGGTGISSILDDPDTYASELNWIRGEDSPDDALVLRNNNRDYYSRGVQSELTYAMDFGAVSSSWTTGVRFHEDEEDRFQSEDGYRMADGTMTLTSDGAPGSQANRVGKGSASSAFLQSDLSWRAWTFSPGIRYEDVSLTRKDFAGDDPDRENGPTRKRSNRITETLLGASILRSFGPNWRGFAGVHEGYNPPAPGSDSDPEESMNYEAGVRYITGGLAAEAVAFYTDYDNLVGTVTESTGGGGEIGDQFDGGSAHVTGLELLADYRINNVAGSGLSVPLGVSWTWTAEAEFDNSFESNFDPWGDVQNGDEIPYIPEHQGRVYAGLAGNRWEMNVNVTYQDEVRTVAGSGSTPSDESTDDFLTVDLLGRWDATDWVSLVLKVNNLFDETYIVSRRPAGVRPGIDRQAFVGANFHF